MTMHYDPVFAAALVDYGTVVPLQIGFYVNLVLAILWEHVMPFVGVLAVVGVVVVQLGHQIPVASARGALGRRLLGRGSRILGKTLIAIQDEDGLWELRPASYDKQNNGYWVETGDGREFYDAAGVGGDPGAWYGGTSLAVAYDGLGALAEVASGEVGRQARIKRQQFDGDLSAIEKAGYQGQQVLATAGEAIRRTFADGDDVVEADGGAALEAGEDGEAVVEEWETLLPERKVVDLRDTLHAAPFHVKPQAFHAVAEEAKRGQRGFASLGPVGQAGLLLGAAMLGGILVYLGLSAAGGGGGGGGGVSIPMAYVAGESLGVV